MNKVIARLIDGSIIKGMTADFFPGKDIFHVKVLNSTAETKPAKINIKDLKALFFVKDFAGNPQRSKSNEFDPARPPAGRRIRVAFKDGEVLVGTTTGYQSNRSGFFIVPADAGSNNERCYVVSAATKEIDFL